MDDERLIILKMVQAGKITAEEAVALLDAVKSAPDTATSSTAEDKWWSHTASERAAGEQQNQDVHPSPVQHDDATQSPVDIINEGSRPAQQEAQVQPVNTEPNQPSETKSEKKSPSSLKSFGTQIDSIIQQAERLTGRVVEEGPQLAEQISEKVAEQVSKLGEKLAGLGSNLADLSSLANLANLSSLSKLGGISGSGSGIEVIDTFTGTLGEAGEVKVDLYTKNGGISIHPWEEPGYKVIAVKRVRAEDKAEAERLAVGAVTVLSGSNYLTVSTQENHQVPSVTLTVYLPAGKLYGLVAATTNGSVKTAELQCRGCRIGTTNGGIHVARLTADEVVAETTNGSINAHLVRSWVFQGDTTNGSIKWSGAARELKLSTTNGSIKANLLALKPKASVEVNEEAAPMMYRLVSSNGSIAVNIEADAAQAPVHFHAKTSFGRITVPDGVYISKQVNTLGARELVTELPGTIGAVLDIEVKTNHGAITLARPKVAGHQGGVNE